MEERDVIIIGGGASGLFLSSLIPSSLLLERNKAIGMKLLLTGGGKCNITHKESEREIINHYYERKSFVSPSIFAFGPDKIESYFRSLGLPLYTREDGKVFPVTERSSDVVKALEKRSGEIWRECSVEKIERIEKGFILSTTKGQIKCRMAVIAAGGASFPLTGSDGSSHSLSSSLGHKIIQPHPALSQIILEEDVSGLEGISVEEAAIKIGKEKSEGALLFTRRGISGPAAQNISRYASSLSDITISLTAFKPEEIKQLEGKRKAIRSVHEATGLPLRLMEERLGWGDRRIGDLSREDIALYRDRIYSWKTKGSTKSLLKEAMVTSGGVDTREIDNRTFQSKICPNLWIIGEALDVDGECGGYNLTFAFASAYLAASDIKARLRNG